MSTETKLHDADHPYYCEEGNYRASSRLNPEVLVPYASWAAFRDEGGYHSSDPDLNLLFRWDWERSDPVDYETEEQVPGDRLLLFFVLQRKADLRTVVIENITEADEPEIRAWLAKRAETITAIWAPIDLGTAAAGSAGGAR